MRPVMQELPKPFVEEVETNPYAPPQAELVPSQAVLDLSEAYETASRVKRFLNWVIDRVAIFGLAFALAFGLAMAEELGFITGALDHMESMGRLEGLILEVVLGLVYYGTLESLFGRTLGKLITGTLVINDAGVRPGLGAILRRSLFRFVPFEAFSMFGSSPWHDAWSQTQVIDLRKKQTVQLSSRLRRLYR